MSERNKIISEFRLVAQDPMSFIGMRKKRDQKAIGFFSSYVPVELLMAAGALPVRMVSFPVTNLQGAADRYIQRYACAYVRGCFERVLAGYYQELDGVIIPRKCETLTMIYDIWQKHTSGFHYFLAVPGCRTTPNARKFFTNELTKLKKELEEFTGTEVTAEELSKTAEQCQENNQLLEQLNQMRLLNSDLVNGSDVLAIFIASWIMPKIEHTKKLNRLLKLLHLISENKVTTGSERRLRIMVVGPNIDCVGLFDLIEKCGLEIVCDNLTTTSKILHKSQLKEPCTLFDIAARYLEIQDPAKYPNNDWTNRIIQKVKKHNIKGVVFAKRMFCESYGYIYPSLRKLLVNEGVKVLYIEIEDQLYSVGQIQNRLEAFREMMLV